jgi:hypothetical protein
VRPVVIERERFLMLKESAEFIVTIYRIEDWSLFGIELLRARDAGDAHRALTRICILWGIEAFSLENSKTSLRPGETPLAGWTETGLLELESKGPKVRVAVKFKELGEGLFTGREQGLFGQKPFEFRRSS